MGFKDLNFIRIQDFRLIPRYLMEQVKGSDAEIDRILQYNFAKDPLTLLYALADDQNKIKGFLWAGVDVFEQCLEICDLKVEDGFEVTEQEAVEFLLSQAKNTGLKNKVITQDNKPSVRIKIWNSDVNDLVEIAEKWADDVADNEFNIEVKAQNHLQDLRKLILSNGSDLLVLTKDDKPVGYIGLKTFCNPLGQRLIANEHYWYVLPEFRGIASVKLIKAADKWAKWQGCSHIILNASNLAGDMHDKVCEFYEKMGMKKFETSYIKEL